jgi:hypothetical protein
LIRMTADLIGPCGMNCALCASYLAYALGLPKKVGCASPCAGCRPRDKRCAFIKKRCARLGPGGIESCHECPDMPCPDLLRIDRLYRTKYGMSMVANLESLKAKGMAAFLRRQKKEHACPACGDIVCVHNGKCYACGAAARPRTPMKPLSAAARSGRPGVTDRT